MYLDDDDQTIYISDYNKNRVVEWKFNATSGRTVADGNGSGNGTNLSAVIVDKTNDSVIICDQGNRQIIRWSLQNSINGDIIISDIACCGVTIDNDGYLYIGDRDNSDVR